MTFKYPPESIQTGNLLITAIQTIDAFESIIYKICKAPPFWKKDAIQELKLCVLECHNKIKNRQPGTQLNPQIVIKRLKQRFKVLSKLERNRGIKQSPDKVDPSELFNNIKQNHYEVDDTGHKLKIHNHL